MDICLWLSHFWGIAHMLHTLKSTMARLAPRLQVVESGDPDSWRAGKTTAERGYGSKWRRARLHHLQVNPLCSACDAIGRVTAGAVIDHKVAHRGNMALFWDRTNWQTMCKRCHDAKREADELEYRVIRPAGAIGSR